jgi:hypothetical protein
MTSHVEEQVKARIAAARRRTEDMRRQRAELAAARKRGLAQRHAQKLRNLEQRRREVIVNFRDWLGQRSRRVALYGIWAATSGTWATAEELHTELHQARVDIRECTHLAAAKDAWLAATEQWEHDCVDCGTDSTDERYMVLHDVWAAAGMCPFGFLCIGCLEQRLGRRLRPDDFLEVLLNTDPGYQRSERLADRLSSATVGQSTTVQPNRGGMTTVPKDQL